MANFKKYYAEISFTFVAIVTFLGILFIGYTVLSSPVNLLNPEDSVEKTEKQVEQKTDKERKEP